MKEKTLTRSQALRISRKTWRKMGTESLPEKPECLEDFYQYCPLCHYVFEVLPDSLVESVGSRQEDQCEKFCPFIWPENICGRKVCYRFGLYSDWIKQDSKETRNKTALQIANLPRKPISNEEREYYESLKGRTSRK